ncbi:MAG: hypothetical protein II621_01870, partial [Clostridia bacterium]|nr:hypothetical protein [Clostridia bacterium]
MRHELRLRHVNCPAGHKEQFNSRSEARNHARSANHDGKAVKSSMLRNEVRRAAHESHIEQREIL